MNIKLWKFITTKDHSLIFNVFGYEDNNNSRPILIFDDAKNDYYYYLLAKPFASNDEVEFVSNTNFDSDFSSQVLLRYTLSDGTINDYLVDCSQLFRIKKSILESYVDSEAISNTNPINQYYVELIKETIFECINLIAPYFSLVDISFDPKDKSITTHSIYLHEDILNFYNIDCNGYELVDSNIYKSIPSTRSKYWNSRYENGINFSRYFLTEYFKKDSKDFDERQKNYYQMLIIKEKAGNLIDEMNQRNLEEIDNNPEKKQEALNKEAINLIS